MAFVECIIKNSGYDVTYVANSRQIVERVEKNADCIANAPSVTKEGWTLIGWREDTQANPNVLTSKICNRLGITLYAVWQQGAILIHGGTITHPAGYWGYDWNSLTGEGSNWSNGAGGSCDGRCGISGCGVSEYHIWVGTGYNTSNGDGTYTPHPGWHDELSYNWTKQESNVTYSNG